MPFRPLRVSRRSALARLAAAFALAATLGAGCIAPNDRRNPPPPTPAPTSTPADLRADAVAASSTVLAFGSKLKTISLLAPEAILREDIRASYGPLVTPEQLTEWALYPGTAPGRLTSSPWPDRVEIAQLERRADGAYVASGEVVFLTSNEAERGDETGREPFEAIIVRRDGAWMIAKWRGADPGSIDGARATFEGTYACLPHRDTGGPQTLECALGLRTSDTGLYFALDTHLLTPNPLMGIPTGHRIVVEGTVVPAEVLSSDRWRRYAIRGIVTVERVK